MLEDLQCRDNTLLTGNLSLSSLRSLKDTLTKVFIVRCYEVERDLDLEMPSALTILKELELSENPQPSHQLESAQGYP